MTQRERNAYDGSRLHHPHADFLSAFMSASLSLSVKRSRDEEFAFEGSSQSASSSPNVTPTTKALRLSRAGATPPLLCTLPPTCHPPHNAPTALSDSNELEAHYAKYHAHVCEERGCAAVFPNARLLELVRLFKLPLSVRRLFTEVPDSLLRHSIKLNVMTP